MMTTSNGNIFRVTGHLSGEFTGHRWIPCTKTRTRSFDVFFDLRLNKRLSKQSWGQWFDSRFKIQTSFIPWKYRYSYLHHYNGHLAKHVIEWQYDIIWRLSLRHLAAVMIATSHNMVHGALRTIIIHKKEYWNKRVRLTHRGPVNMDIVLYITYLNVYLRWDCFILFQVSPRYLKWSLYQHPICFSKYWSGAE